MNKFILILVIIGFAAAIKADSYHNLWTAWKTQHKKSYSAAEELTRFGVFVENILKINRLNAESDSARYALNKFADLTATEFKLKHATGGFHETHRKFVAANSRFSPIRNLPDSVDWRNKGAVTPVKDQGQCGSCWAFSATGVLEGFNFINNGKLLSFSEQQIVDCDTNQNEGCNGGWPYLALEYAAQNGLEVESDYPYTAVGGKCNYEQSKAVTVANNWPYLALEYAAQNGLEVESDYPYTAVGGKCNYEQSKAVTVANNWQFVLANDTDQLKAALVSSPVSVLIEADQDSFQFYKSGVIRGNCGAELDHAVLAVGYQKVGIFEAFIVKNSWGTSWGQDGYVYIGTDQKPNKGQGVCGILAQPIYALNI